MCRGLAFRDVTVSTERLETTIMYTVPRGRFRRDQYDCFKTANIYTLMKIKQLTDKAK